MLLIHTQVEYPGFRYPYLRGMRISCQWLLEPFRPEEIVRTSTRFGTVLCKACRKIDEGSCSGGLRDLRTNEGGSGGRVRLSTTNGKKWKIQIGIRFYLWETRRHHLSDLSHRINVSPRLAAGILGPFLELEPLSPWAFVIVNQWFFCTVILRKILDMGPRFFCPIRKTRTFVFSWSYLGPQCAARISVVYFRYRLSPWCNS